MNRIPKILVKNKQDSAKPRRKLERSNAMKNIKVDAFLLSASSSSSSSSLFPEEEPSAALRSRSLDLSLFPDGTSFRFEGNEDELEIIYKKLGVSCAEDLGIPVAEYETLRVSSCSDLLPRLSCFNGRRFNGTYVATENIEPQNGSVIDQKIESSNVEYVDCSRVSDQESVVLSIESVVLNDSSDFATGCSGRESRVRAAVGEVCDLSCRVGDSCLTASNANLGENEGVKLSGGRGGGIKGVRPPILAPPPAMSLPRCIDDGCSTWDLLRGLAPEDDGGLEFEGRERFSLEDTEGNLDIVSGLEEETEEEEINDLGRRIGGSGLLSDSYSFTTTSNDDDSSSSTTEPMSIISPNGKFRRSIGFWERGELLGSGSFGSVYEGIADGGFFFAVKEVSLLDQGNEGRQRICQLEQEIALLSRFEHENIVQYYCTDKDDSKLYIFLELVPKGSLLSLYQKYHLRDSQVSVYTLQILHGLKYLHDRNVVHRDIKCANILVDASGFVKLADFGLAKATKLNDVNSCKGTAFWMAPEVVRSQQGYGLAADIWSLGCTVLEMLTRRFPYSNLECMQALFRIGGGKLPDVPDTLSRDSRDFILKCLQVDPHARPTAAQLLEHPFVKRPVPLSSGSASPQYLGRRIQ